MRSRRACPGGDSRSFVYAGAARVSARRGRRDLDPAAARPRRSGVGKGGGAACLHRRRRGGAGAGGAARFRALRPRDRAPSPGLRPARHRWSAAVRRPRFPASAERTRGGDRRLRSSGRDSEEAAGVGVGLGSHCLSSAVAL